MPERLFTLYQVADLLGSSPSEITSWIRKGWLTCQRLGNEARVSETNLIQFLKRQGVNIEEVLAKSVLAEPQLPEQAALPAMPEPQPQQPDIPAMPRPEAPAVKRASSAQPVTSPNIHAIEQVAADLLHDALGRSASAIHLEPANAGRHLAMRVDGWLNYKAGAQLDVSAANARELAGYFKKLSGLTEGAPSRAQRGTFSVRIDGRDVQFHLSACPTNSGERIVIRPEEAAGPALKLPELGMNDAQLASLRRAMSLRCGLILLCGTPGSGASTTLRAMAQELSGAGRHVVSVQRPAEVAGVPTPWRAGGEIEGACRIQVHPSSEFTSAVAIRAAADQDADVILVEEVGEAATLSAAVENVRQGRLVIARLFVRTVPAAMDLLLEVDLDPWLRASMLQAVMAQSVVRRLCPHCKRPDASGAEALARMAPSGGGDGPVFVPVGCGQCAQSGYLGRTGVFSLLTVDETVARLLRSSNDVSVLMAALEEAAPPTLLQAGLENARRGMTSLTEVSSLP